MDQKKVERYYEHNWNMKNQLMNDTSDSEDDSDVNIVGNMKNMPV